MGTRTLVRVGPAVAAARNCLVALRKLGLPRGGRKLRYLARTLPDVVSVISGGRVNKKAAATSQGASVPTVGPLDSEEVASQGTAVPTVGLSDTVSAGGYLKPQLSHSIFLRL